MGPAKRTGRRCVRTRFSVFKTHAELDLLSPGDGLSGVVAAAVGLPTCRPLGALGPDELGRLLVERRVERLFEARHRGLPGKVREVAA